MNLLTDNLGNYIVTDTGDNIGLVETPISLTLTISGADLVVTWTAVSGADHYRYSTDGGETWTTKTNPFTITGGAKGRQPAILQAIDADGNVVGQGYILGVGMMLAF